MTLTVTRDGETRIDPLGKERARPALVRDGPDTASDGGPRFNVTLLFPK